MGQNQECQPFFLKFRIRDGAPLLLAMKQKPSDPRSLGELPSIENCTIFGNVGIVHETSEICDTRAISGSLRIKSNGKNIGVTEN